jgi:hypothetical protein
MQFDKDFFILLIGLIIVSIFYVLASFGYKYLEEHNVSFKYIYILSLLAGVMVYVIKIPLFYYYDLDNALITYMLYMIVVSVTVTLFSTFVLKEKIHTHTYIIMSIIMCLFIFNDYLTSLK